MTRVLCPLIPLAVLALLAGLVPGQQAAYKSEPAKPTVFSSRQMVQWQLLDPRPAADDSARKPLDGPAIDGSHFLRQAGFTAAWHFNDAIRKRGGNPMVTVGLLQPGFGEHDQLRSKYKGNPGAVWKPEQLTREPLKMAFADAGTFIAGVIAVDGDDNKGIRGCSPFVQIYPVAIGPDFSGKSNPKEGIESFDRVRVALADLVRRKEVRVIHVGWAANYQFRSPTDSERQITLAMAQMLAPVVDEAAAKGILLVSPAGNDSFGDRRVNACWSSPLNYLALKGSDGKEPRANVIVVESADRKGDRSQFSNAGGHLAAPGEHVMGLAVHDEKLEVKSGYTVKSGTGPAAAQVTGLIAHLLAYNPDLKIEEILGHLKVRKPVWREAPPPAPAPMIDAFDAMLRCKKGSWKDLADLDGNGRVDRNDFERLRRAVGEVEQAKVPALPREDLNGDGRLARNVRARLWNPERREYQNVTDLEVMMAVWEDPGFARPEELPRRLVEPR